MMENVNELPERNFHSREASAPRSSPPATLHSLARCESPILIQVEPGSDGRALARSLHEHSARRDEPFVIVRCEGKSSHALARELFGHSDGFLLETGTVHAGVVAAAHGGTLYFEDISELPHALAPALLRLLDLREIYPVGSITPQQVSVRVLSGSASDLYEAAGEGRFPAELYYRLAWTTLNAVDQEEAIQGLERAEYAAICRTLRENHGNLTRAALRLNIARSTLYAKLKRYGLEHRLAGMREKHDADPMHMRRANDYPAAVAE